MVSDGSQNVPGVAIPVAEFEGEFVRSFEGKLPAITLDMPEGFVRGTHLKMEVEVRVRNVSYLETKETDLVRQHVLALEEVKLVDAFDPANRPDPLSGNLSATAEPWEEAFLDFVHGDVDMLDFDGEPIPDRLRDILKAYFDSLAPSENASDPEGAGF